MEVHHHSHTPRIKWTHYFWEFLMLFLAVFAGFLAENQREHYIEHLREKKFMKTMVEDLEADTVMLMRSITAVSDRIKNIDSVLLYLHRHRDMKEASKDLFRIAARSLLRLNIVFTDRTSVQLKNAGGMRLIRKKNVADAIVTYWNQIEAVRDLLERYHNYRNEGRIISIKFLQYYEYYMRENGILSDSLNTYPFINNDPALREEYGNIVALCGVVLRPGFQDALKAQLKFSTELINLIKEEYHIE